MELPFRTKDKVKVRNEEHCIRKGPQMFFVVWLVFFFVCVLFKNFIFRLLYFMCMSVLLTYMSVSGFFRVAELKEPISINIERGFIRMASRLQSSYSNNGWL